MDGNIYRLFSHLGSVFDKRLYEGQKQTGLLRSASHAPLQSTPILTSARQRAYGAPKTAFVTFGIARSIHGWSQTRA
jgi:hypothetical protein